MSTIRTAALTARRARLADAPAITAIDNQGIEDRVGTFETEPRTVAQIAVWFEHAKAFVVVEDEDCASLNLMAWSGFKEICVHEKHGQLDGVWRACVIVERVFPETLDYGRITGSTDNSAAAKSRNARTRTGINRALAVTSCTGIGASS